MDKFNIHKGRTVSVMYNNIDTDQIIPKQYLKSIERTGFGDYAFDEWRYNEDRTNNETFPLNFSDRQGATILVTGENFGCGSSREHAVWALQDYGFHVIIAGSYSDIFYNNWLNNGHLPIILGEEERNELSKLNGDEQIEIDLPNQKIITPTKTYSFELNDMWKNRLLEGLDSIGITLTYLDKIEEYERVNK